MERPQHDDAVEIGQGLGGWASPEEHTRFIEAETYDALGNFGPQYQADRGRRFRGASDIAESLTAESEFQFLDQDAQLRVMRTASQLRTADWDACEALDRLDPIPASDIARLAIALDNYPFPPTGAHRSDVVLGLRSCAYDLDLPIDDRRFAHIAGVIFSDRPLQRITGNQIDIALKDYIKSANRTLLEQWYAGLITSLPNQDTASAARPESAAEALAGFVEPALAERLPDAFLRQKGARGMSDEDRKAFALFDEKVLRAFQVQAFSFRRISADITGLNFETLMVNALEQCGYMVNQSDDKGAAADINFALPGWDKPISLQLKTTIQEKGGLAMKNYTNIESMLTGELEDLGKREGPARYEEKKWARSGVAARSKMMDDQTIADLVQKAIGVHMTKYDGVVHMSDPVREGDFSTCTFSSVNNTHIAKRLRAVKNDPVKVAASVDKLKFVRNPKSIGIDLHDDKNNRVTIRIGIAGTQKGTSSVSVSGPMYENEIATVQIPFAQTIDRRGTREELQQELDRQRAMDTDDALSMS